MLYPEQFLTKDLMLLDIRHLPATYRSFSVMAIKQFLEMGFKEDGYLFVGEAELCRIEAPYSLYMSLCETIDLPDWDRPCTLHITVYDRYRLVIRHLTETQPEQQPMSLHTFSYLEWDTRLRDVLEPYRVCLNSPEITLDMIIEAAVDWVVCESHAVDSRATAMLDQYLSTAMLSDLDANTPSVLGRILNDIRMRIYLSPAEYMHYLHTVDTKRCVINLVCINKQPD